MSKNVETLLKVPGLNDKVAQRLTPKDKELLAEFNKKVFLLKEERGIPDGHNEPDELVEEALQAVPGSKQALDRQTKIFNSFWEAEQE